MANWDYIESGFSAADETINFGTRNFASIGDLYETTTLSLLKNSEDAPYTTPQIAASIHNTSIFFSINKSMRVFKDCLCSNLCFSNTFDDEIDAYCVTSDGQFLLVCLRNSSVYCLKLENGDGEPASVIYAEALGENADLQQKFFLKAFVENIAGQLSFLMVLKDGRIYRLATTSSSSPNGIADEDSFKFDLQENTDLKCSLQTASFAYPILLATGLLVYVYNVYTKELMNSSEDWNFKQTFACNSRKFLGLNWNGHLIQFCPKTMLAYTLPVDMLFESIVLHFDAITPHILGVTKKTNEGQSNLLLLSYPDCDTIFSLKISEEIHLITPESINDEIIYIAEVKNGDDVSELRFQHVSETDPENRLKRLLRRQRFEEAEQFAKLFALDLVEIQKAKAQVIVDKTVCDEADVTHLLNILNLIQDDGFKLQSCWNAYSSCSNFEDVERILNYGHNLIYQSNKEICDEMENLISNLMVRFNTFMALVKCGSIRNSIQDWNEFSTCDLLEELILTLEHHRMEESAIIYNRLDSTTISNLSEYDISDILDILDNINMEEQLSFLYTFLPLTLSYLPPTIDLFIKWTKRKVFSIEIKHPSQFPENAIQFMKKIAHLLKVESSTISYQQYTANQEFIEDLAELLQALERLEIIKSDYGIVVPLEQFLNKRKETLIETLTMVIYNRYNEQLVEELIQTFTLDKELKFDEIYMDMIKEIVKYAEEWWIKVLPLILKSVSAVELKLQATLIILKAASIPWCTTVSEIANSCLQYSHPLVEQIVQEIEFEPKCVILKKYGIKQKFIDTPQYPAFAINRIIYRNEPTMIEDIYQLCSKDSAEKHEADIILICHFINTGNFEKALNILDNNSPEEVTECCKELAEMAYIAINNQYKLPSLEENYYQIIGSIFSRLQKNAMESEKLDLQEELERLRNVYKIRRNFNLDIKCSDLSKNHNRKNEILQSLIFEVIKDFQDTRDISNCIKKCDEISTCLGFEGRVLLRVCEEMGDFKLLLKAAENVYENELDPRILCPVVTLILKCIGSPNMIKSNDESLLHDFGNVDLKVFVDGLNLARKIVVKAILQCKENYLDNCVELANWVQSTYYFVQVHEDQGTFSFARGDDCGMDLSVSALNAVKDVFLFYMHTTEKFITLNTHYLKKYNVTPDLSKQAEMQIETKIQSLQATIKRLYIEGHAVTAYTLVQTLQRSLIYNSSVTPDLRTILSVFIDESVKQSLRAVFAKQHIDEPFALNLVMSVDVNYSKRFLRDMLKMYKRDAVKFRSVAYIFLQFLQYYNIEDGQVLCKNVIYLMKWWKKVKNCRLPYEQFFKNPSEVIENLIKLNHLDIALIAEFCSDFNLQVQTYYELYLKNLLLNWRPVCVIDTDVFGKRQLTVKDNEMQLFNTCMEVINIIQNNEVTCNMMHSIWGTINFYHYEVFMCILNILSTFEPNTDTNQLIMLLTFLKKYTRVSKPGEAEVEEWCTLYPDAPSIDALSEWRLPYTPTLLTSKIWNIIRPEMNLKTYTVWFQAIAILKKHLTKDNICSYVIKEVVASGVFQSKDTQEWNLHAKHKDLLTEIDVCVQNISGLERATSTLYYLVNNIPKGADQVNAITLCHKCALKYQKLYPHMEDVQKAVIKIQKKYYAYAATHILHMNQLADKNYLNLVSHPVDEMIETLYMDCRILKKASFVTLNCPDINKTVDELAALYNIDLQEKRISLVKAWLSSSTSSSDFNLSSSIYTNSSLGVQSMTYRDGGIDNLIRASYVCMSGDVVEWRIWLLMLGKVEATEPSRNLSLKANALHCLCNISDAQTIEELTQTTCQEFRNYVKKLMLLSGLESLGFSLTIESLDSYSKKELLHRLSYNVSNPLGVRTMTLLCAAYAIYETKYWTVIISAMVKLNMMTELKDCVNFLRKCAVIQNKKLYVDAWQAVVNTSFNLPLNLPEDHLTCLCVDNFYAIQSCPVLFALDLELVVQKCIELKKYDFAALGVQYLPKDKQSIYVKNLLNLDQSVLEKVGELLQFGFCGVLYVKNLFMNFGEEL